MSEYLKHLEVHLHDWKMLLQDSKYMYCLRPFMLDWTLIYDWFKNNFTNLAITLQAVLDKHSAQRALKWNKLCNFLMIVSGKLVNYVRTFPSKALGDKKQDLLEILDKRLNAGLWEISD